MTNEEKQLITNLFSRLYQTEIDLPHRDSDVEQLIASFLDKQKNAYYYMAQTLLVQEIVIKQLNDKVSALENELSIKNERNKITSSNFLSSLFNKNNKSMNLDEQNTKKLLNNNSYAIPGTQGRNSNSINDDLTNSSSTSKGVFDRNSNSHNTSTTQTSGSSFLSGALQTATGVAGGMVMANLLTNLFQHKKPEEEIISQIHNVDSAHINDLQDSDSKKDVISNIDDRNITNEYTEEVNSHSNNHSSYQYDSNHEEDHDNYENDSESDIFDDNNFI